MSSELDDLLVRIKSLIKPDSVEWDDVEIELAILLNQKYAFCTNQDKPVPGMVYETTCQGIPLTNSDIAVIYKGQIYLPRRDSLKTKAHEFVPNTLHLSGGIRVVTDLVSADTAQRVIEKELISKRFNIHIDDLALLGTLDLPQDGVEGMQRGPVQSNLFYVEIDQIPKGLENDFYGKEDMPWNELVYSHKTVTLPWLINQDYVR